MKRKTGKYIFIFSILVCLVLFLVMPRLGWPTRGAVNYQRTEQLNNWRQAVIYYLQRNKEYPAGLYDVYQCSKKEKYNIYLAFLIWTGYEREEILVKDYKILENGIVFNEKVEYELIHKGESWFVQEKKIYPRFFKELWMIDQDGNISPISQK
jgi:hypothetical protein